MLPFNRGGNGTPEHEATSPREDDDAVDRAIAFTDACEERKTVAEKRINEAIQDRGRKAARVAKVRGVVREMSELLKQVETDHELARVRVVQLKAECNGVEVKGEEEEEAEADTALSAEEEAAVAAVERAAADEPKETLNGFPIELNPEANGKFERLLQAKVLNLFKEGAKQVIAPGRNGTRQNVFENKELFKEVTPRFFWQPEKVWAREAPEGWLS